MNKVACFDCHGNLTRVGQKTRDGWLDEPSRQMCHNTSQQYLTTFDQNGQWRQTSDTTFATNPNKPLEGKNLYRFSSGRGNVYCSGCLGSQHAEYPVTNTHATQTIGQSWVSGHEPYAENGKYRFVGIVTDPPVAGRSCRQLAPTAPSTPKAVRRLSPRAISSPATTATTDRACGFLHPPDNVIKVRGELARPSGGHFM